MTSAFHTKWFKPLIVLFLLLGIPLSYADDLQKDLMLYLNMDGDVQDHSGQGHHGVNNGRVTFKPSPIGGQAAFFNGSRYGGIKVPDASDFNFHNESFSYSTWVKIYDHQYNYYRAYISLSNRDGSPRLDLGKGRGGATSYRNKAYMQVYKSGKSKASLKSNNPPPLHEWIHLASVIDYENQTSTLYIDGKLVNTMPLVDFNVSSPILTIGSFSWYHRMMLGHYGLMDEVRIYGRALSESEVKKLSQTTPNIQIDREEVFIELGETLDLKSSFADVDGDGPYSYRWEFGDGNSMVGSIEQAGEIPADYTYMQPGQFLAKLEITDKSGNTGIVKVTVNVLSNVTNNPCDPKIITLRSNIPPTLPVKITSWSMPFSWDGMRVPTENDWVLIKAGHTVILPPEGKIKVKGLCIEQEGILNSNFNSLTTSTTQVNLSAVMIHNKGKIIGAQGINGSLLNGAYKHATAGSDIKIFAYRFLNDETGIVSANGRGGDDVLYNHYPLGTGVLTALGGDGGNVELYPTIFINKGLIESGRGGNGDTFAGWRKFVYGHAFGGDGGTVKIFPSNINQSTNTGTIQAGKGGFADGISRWMRYVVWRDSRTGEYLDYDKKEGRLYTVDAGRGGNVTANLTNVSGIIQGSRGGEANRTLMRPTITRWVWIDPTTMTVDENTRINSAENIVLFGGDDWTMDLRKLSPNAIEAEQNIILAVGENSTIDLRGVTGKVFVAKEKVTIYTDNVLLDAGVSLQDLIDAPEVEQLPSKILYHVELSHDKRLVAEPNEVLPIQIDILNNSPKPDTYTVTIEDDKGWQINAYPQQVKVESLRRTQLTFETQASDIRGEHNTFTVTVTSENDNEVQASAEIQVNVKTLPKNNPRSPRADIAIVMDDSYRMGNYLHTIANALEATLRQQLPEYNAPAETEIVEFLDQFDENNPVTHEALQNFFNQYQPTDIPVEIQMPTMELITFSDQIKSHIVTDNLAEIIGHIRNLELQPNTQCTNKVANAIDYALSNLNTSGQIMLASSGDATLNDSYVLNRLNNKQAKLHVLLAGTCQDGETEKAKFKQLAESTKGLFYWLPQQLNPNDVTNMILNEVLNMVVTTDDCSSLAYAVQDHRLNDSEFLTISPETLEINSFSPVYEGYDIESLALEPNSCVLYAASGDNATQDAGALYIVNKQTGELALVGQTGHAGIEGLDFDANGELWAWATGDGLVKLDTETATSTMIFMSDSEIEDIEWNQDNTVLYAAEQTTLWAWDGEKAEAVYALPDETEALELLPNNVMLLGIHNSNTLLNMQLISLRTRLKMGEIDVPTLNDDIEGIAYQP